MKKPHQSNKSRERERESANGIYLEPVLMKSFKVDALCVPLARQPNATHNAVSIALLPPIDDRDKQKYGIIRKQYKK